MGTLKKRIVNQFKQLRKGEALAYILFCVAGIFVSYLGISLFAGATSIVFGSENIPSAEASIQMAMLATALGAGIVWFTSRDTSDFGEAVPLAQGQKRLIVYVGWLLILAAFCFAFFGLLSSILPEVLGKENPI